MGMRWIGFLRALSAPFSVDVGSVVALDESQALALYASLRDSKKYLFDLTPRPVALFFNPRGFPNPAPLSSICFIPCPVCSREQGISMCQHCGGRRKLLWPHKLPLGGCNVQNPF